MFKNYDTSNLLKGLDTPLWEIGRCTSSAQKYFPAYQYGSRAMWDGGNVMNNPAVGALADAVKLWGDDEPVKVLVLGCGYSKAEVPSWPIWVQDLLLTIKGQFQTGQEEVAYQMKQFIGDNYREVQPVFASSLQLDGADPQSLQWLNEAGVQMVADHRRDFEWFLS